MRFPPLLCPTLCVTPERVALGITDAWMMAAAVPNSRWVYVADREGDLTALMQRAEQLGHRKGEKAREVCQEIRWLLCGWGVNALSYPPRSFLIRWSGKRPMD